MRSEHEANLAIEKYGDMVKRICFLHLKNEFDTEDIFQNVFIKYKAYQELLKYYPDITPEECNELSMNEIKNLILESGWECGLEIHKIIPSAQTQPTKQKDRTAKIPETEKETAINSEIKKEKTKRKSALLTEL